MALKKLAKGYTDPEYRTSKSGLRMKPSTIGLTEEETPATFKTKSKKNAAGEIINPTKEDVSRFNKMFTTTKPKKSYMGGFVSGMKKTAKEAKGMISKMAKKIK